MSSSFMCSGSRHRLVMDCLHSNEYDETKISNYILSVIEQHK